MLQQHNLPHGLLMGIPCGEICEALEQSWDTEHPGSMLVSLVLESLWRSHGAGGGRIYCTPSMC